MLTQSRSIIPVENLPYPRFGIENRPLADHGKGNLPRVTQGLQSANRDMQVVAKLLARQVAFRLNRRLVVLFRCPQPRVGLVEVAEQRPHLFTIQC